MAFVGFQAVFAIITVALISGAIADRAKFGAWMVFAAIWATSSTSRSRTGSSPSTATRSSAAGSPTTWRAIDFAGGTAVHINAGAAGLALALVLGKRRGFGREAMRPHNLPLVMIGAGLLWFGWFGFNAGSALAANNTAAVVWVNTLVATAAATLGWLLVEKIRDGHSTSLGAASGVVAGLVAITPACSAVSPIGAIIVGLVAGVLCALAVGLKYRFGYDDSLDVVGVHLVGGLVGTIIIGFLATARTLRRASTASSTAVASTSSGGRSSVRLPCWATPSSSRWSSASSSRRRSASGSPRRTRSPASTTSCTRSPATTSPRSAAVDRPHHWPARPRRGP